MHCFHLTFSTQDYSRYRTKDGPARFGGCSQQDASEWLDFLFNEVQDETDKTGRSGTIAFKAKVNQEVPALQAAVEYWLKYRTFSRSIIDRYFRGVEVSLTACGRCKHVSKRAELMTVLNVPLEDEDGTLAQQLRAMGEGQDLFNYECERKDTCNGTKGPAKNMRRLARMPEVLVVVLLRYGRSLHKLKTHVAFDVDGESFEPYFVPPEQRALAAPAPDDGFGGEFRYRCYGVVTHDGNTLNAGHYVSYVRDLRAGDAAPWWRCDDARVERMPRGRVEAMCRGRTKAGDGQPFMMFFTRMGSGPERTREARVKSDSERAKEEA